MRDAPPAPCPVCGAVKFREHCPSATCTWEICNGCHSVTTADRLRWFVKSRP